MCIVSAHSLSKIPRKFSVIKKKCLFFNTISKTSSSSCCAASTDIPDPLSPLLPIIHRLWQVFRATTHILLYVWSNWSSCCSITSLTKVSKWGSQYYLNRNLGPYFHLGQGMLSQNPSPLTLLSSLLSPFLSRSPSPSGQSAEIVAVAEDNPRTEEEAVAEEIPDTKHVCWPPDIFLANTWRCIRRIKFLF